MADEIKPEPEVLYPGEGKPTYVRLPLEGGGIALIDAEDEELVRSLGRWTSTPPPWSWWSIGGRKYEYRRNNRGSWFDWSSHSRVAYICFLEEGATMFGGTTVYLHELVMGAREGQEVYPANGNGLDCRKRNLRIRVQQKSK
jgi:hypothetical protein